jgi:hypothetical protein
VVVFSSPDENLLKKVVQNLAEDFGALFLNLFPYLKDMENIDNRTISSFFNVDSNVIFVIGPAFPTYYIKALRFNYHISINLNNTLIEERNVNKDMLKIYEQYSSIKYSFIQNKKNNEVRSSISKTLNLSKFKNTTLLEDEIFNILIEYIEKKLDSGKYVEKKLSMKDEKGVDVDNDENIFEEVEIDTYMSDDKIMREVNFETSDSDFIIGGMRKLNK